MVDVGELQSSDPDGMADLLDGDEDSQMDRMGIHREHEVKGECVEVGSGFENVVELYSFIVPLLDILRSGFLRLRGMGSRGRDFMHLQLDSTHLRRQRVRCPPQGISLEHFEEPDRPIVGSRFFVAV